MTNGHQGGIVRTDEAHRRGVHGSVRFVSPKEVAKVGSGGLRAVVQMGLATVGRCRGRKTDFGHLQVAGRGANTGGRRREMRDEEAVDTDVCERRVSVKDVSHRVRIIIKGQRGDIRDGVGVDRRCIIRGITCRGGRQLQGWRIRCPASIGGSSSVGNRAASRRST